MVVRSKSKGSLLFPQDFMEFGSSTAIRKALERLTEKAVLQRLAQGIYVRQKVNPLIGPLTPPIEKVAEAIARRDKMRIIPSGSYALNALGLSTQIPMNIVLLTDGSPRSIKIGKRTIRFKKAAPKTLLVKGKISSLVIQALKAIGKGKVTPEEEARILGLLRQENTKDLQHDIALSPVWIQEIMKKAL